MSGDIPSKDAKDALARFSKGGEVELRLLFESSLLTSLLQLILIGAAAAFFVGWWAVLWFVLMAGLVIQRHASNNQAQIPDGPLGPILIALGTTFYVVIWAAAWMVGGAEAGFVAGTLLGTQALMSTTFFSGSRLHFIANLGPALLATAAVPFLIYDHPVPVIITLICTLQMLVASLSTRANRNALIAEVTRVQSEMEAARDESLAKSQFLAMMSHELRTPLNSIIGYSEMLEEDLSEEGLVQSAEDAQRVRRSATNLLTIINEILDFSKIEAGRLTLQVEHVDVAEIVHEAAQTVEPAAAAHGTVVSVDIAPDARVVHSDGQRLRQCLLNLMSNAAKFTERGRIDVRVRTEMNGETRMLRIDVADNGCGISQADAARLFQPFTQADGSLTRKKDGTGLGLVITKRLSEMMGGDVSLQSALNVGSTFTLRVRDQAPAAKAAEPASAPVFAPSLAAA